MPTAEEQTADMLGSLGTKDFPSSCIAGHQDDNDSEPTFGDFTGSLKTPVPKDHTSDSDGHSLWSLKHAKKEYDVLSDHGKMTSNPIKQKWLFLTLTEFDKDKEEDLNEGDPNDPSYHTKDNISDDEDDDEGLKYLGMKPSAKFVDVTHWHQWDLDLSWVKNVHKGLLKVLRIKPEGLTGQKRDCTAILAQILKQANINNVFPMGSDAPEDLSLHELWPKALVTGITFIHFHPDGERLSGKSMGIQRIHNPLALRHRQVKDDKMPKSFCPWCCKYGGNATTIANHIRQDPYKLGMVCP